MDTVNAAVDYVGVILPREVFLEVERLAELIGKDVSETVTNMVVEAVAKTQGGRNGR